MSDDSTTDDGTPVVAATTPATETPTPIEEVTSHEQPTVVP